MQWFRFYTEAISDKKLRRIARDNNESMAYVIGVWTIVLSMASDSPDRGRLMISGEVPATIDDISDAAGCNVTETFQKLLVTGLVTVDVTDDGQNVYVIPAWDKRQFESDSSATRVRKHRERKKSAESSANVTGVKRYSNAPDTDTDTDHICSADAVPTAQQNSPEPEKPTRAPRKRTPAESDAPSESGEMFTRLCFVLYGHVNTSNGGLTEKQRGLLNKEAKRLREAGATPEDLGDWYKTVWRKNWPGTNNQAPTVSQVVAGVNAWRMKKQETAADPYVVDVGDPSGARWVFNRGTE